MKLTNSNVLALPIPDGPQTYTSDSALAGFGVMVNVGSEARNRVFRISLHNSNKPITLENGDPGFDLADSLFFTGTWAEFKARIHGCAACWREACRRVRRLRFGSHGGGWPSAGASAGLGPPRMLRPAACPVPVLPDAPGPGVDGGRACAL